MSEGKRKVSTDALETLGTIIEAGGRDAIHLAVEPAIAAEDLYPGQHVGLGRDGATTNGVKKLGIVDPFILGMIPKGKMFWLVVYPRQITSLRHVWEHPDFQDKKEQPAMASKGISEAWLRNFCKTHDCPRYESVIAAYLNGDANDEYFHFYGEDAHDPIPHEFWDHIETVTGIKPISRPEYFSCTC